METLAMAKKELVKATSAMTRVLIIDDEVGIRDLLTQELSRHGYETESVIDGEEALAKMDQTRFRVVFCDLNLPKRSGMEVMEEIRKKDPEIEVIMMTGNASIETAVTAMKKGAYDFVQKPFNLEEVLALAAKSIEKSELRRTIQELRETKKRLEDAQVLLIQSEKLAGIGQLAAGVAHELNNPLSGVMGFSQLLLDDKTLSAQQRKDIETIHEQSQRCRTIIQNLLQFSRRKDPKMEPLDIEPLLKRILDLVRYDFSTSGVELIQKIASPLPLIFGDSHQMEQVCLNLMTNARQAMEGRKKSQLSIEVGAVEGKLRMSFRDNGPGIPPDIQGKVFDPFFTTKPPGKGTGLGLSICYGIVQEHRGTLRLESALGKGTAFVVELPIYDLS